MIEAKVIRDSISEEGVRLTTMQIKFHRFCLPEFNTHRMFSRNFSSSRAIPISKMIEQVQNDPAMPIYWGKNKAGMQAVEELENTLRLNSKWKDASLSAYHRAKDLLDMEVHKQVTNRLLEPFMWVNGVVTATEWNNFYLLRDHPAAQPEIQKLAQVMKLAMDDSTPKVLKNGEWHLPYITEDDIDDLVDYINDSDDAPVAYDHLKTAAKLSAARCARVSYNKHDGSAPSIEDDLELYNQLATRPHTDKRGFHYGVGEPVHLSPLEHQATPIKYPCSEDPTFEDGVTHKDKYNNFWSGNFRGWVQYRKMLED